MPEKVAHALVVVNPPDALGQKSADVHSFDLVALQFEDLVGHCVGYHNLQKKKIKIIIIIF